MDFLQIASSLFAPGIRLFNWLKNRANPARLQAARILQVFEAHNVERTQINRLSPPDLQLTQFEWSSADELKKVLKPAHIDWAAGFFALEPGWLDGVSNRVHTLIHSYKTPGNLHRWFLSHAAQGDQGVRYKLHLLTSDSSAITAASSGCYAVVLEEFLGEANGYLRRYYHLADGAHFDHYPCVVHLMQILAIAHFHGVIMRRAVIGTASLNKLSNCEGLIPELLYQARRHPLEADHEFWGHFSGVTHWLLNLRQHTETSLLEGGLHDVVASIHQDRQRFARPIRN